MDFYKTFKSENIEFQQYKNSTSKSKISYFGLKIFHFKEKISATNWKLSQKFCRTAKHSHRPFQQKIYSTKNSAIKIRLTWPRENSPVFWIPSATDHIPMFTAYNSIFLYRVIIYRYYIPWLAHTVGEI